MWFCILILTLYCLKFGKLYFCRYWLERHYEAFRLLWYAKNKTDQLLKNRIFGNDPLPAWYNVYNSLHETRYVFKDRQQSSAPFFGGVTVNFYLCFVSNALYLYLIGLNTS